MKRRTKAVSRERAAPQTAAAYDVVALVASAGGHAAIEAVLRALPRDFSVPIVVMQHLAPNAAEPLHPFARRLPFAVEWARNGSVLATGEVLVAPPRCFLELLPDGMCVLSPCDRGALDKPMDRLLESLVRSYAHRAIVVVLSGLMSDGAAGARALRAAGGTVIVQSGAEYRSMPDAVVQAGAADVSLPMEKIGALLIDLAEGAAIPRPLLEVEAIAWLFAGEGHARSAMRDVLWSDTPLGPLLAWPDALSTAVRNVMGSPFPSCIYWGPEFVQIYNEAFMSSLGAKPTAAGKPARLTWPELWSTLGPQLESVLRTGQAVFAEDQLFQPERHGYPEEVYLTYSYSPLFDAEGTVRGVLGTSTETTGRVRAARRLKTLRDIAAIKSGESPLLVAQNAAKVLADAALDVPFALVYLFDKGRAHASLAAAVGVEAGAPGAPHWLLLDSRALWPLADVAHSGSVCSVNNVAARFSGAQSAPLGPWPEPPTAAKLLPLWKGADGPIAGVIVIGMSPRLRADPTYDDFLRMVAQHLTNAIGDAESRASVRERADRLAELDRAKLDFFSNVSHEFRTPLTLLLGPLEELLARGQAVPAEVEDTIAAAARNGRRLLTLVNTLLDFSQAESQRERAHFQPTDFAAHTLDIASAFRSTIEAAGLSFDVRAEPGVPEVWLDRQMWEKIVSNLLSNALKFTFAGGIKLEIRARSLLAELVITDTGIGIAQHEIPNLFKRFHRVQGARARTADGSGIGLWMVDDLVKRLGGQLRVRSKPNVGTEFTIWIHYKSPRIDDALPQLQAALRPSGFATQLARDASRWSFDSASSSDVLDDVFGAPRGPAKDAGAQQGRILVADDNADMREYLERLLRPRWQVETVPDGVRALEAAVATRPDIVLADVMMPRLDGFELLKSVRAHAELRHVPVVLLTARAGEETAIEGLLAGADDYIAKPFSPRELVARVAACIERARAEAALRESEERFRTLFETVEEGFCYLSLVRDAEGEACDVITLEANEAYAQHSGLDLASLRERRSSDVFGPYDNNGREWLQVYERVVRTGEPARRELYDKNQGRWFAVSVYARSGERFAILLSDITERKSRELQRQTYLLRLSDELRPLAEVVDTQRAATRVLGERLAADRVLYAEITQDGETADIRDNYVRDGVPLWTGSFPMHALSEPAARVQRGEIVVLTDVHAHHEQSDALVRASISVPLVKDGRLAALLVVHQRNPRVWTEDEIALVQETAERTWAAVARGRVEAELRARHDELERFHNVTVGRELRMIELKKQVNALRRRLRQPPNHPLAFEEVDGNARVFEEPRKRVDVREAKTRSARVAELKKANAEARDARSATLNMLEDVVEARDRAEQLYGELKERERWLRGQRDALTAAVSGERLATSLEALVSTATAALGEHSRAAFYLADDLGTTLHHVVGMPPPKNYDYRGCWSFPIHSAAGKFVGTLALYSQGPREPGARELELASLLTHTASIIISRHTEAEVRKQAERALRERERGAPVAR